MNDHVSIHSPLVNFPSLDLSMVCVRVNLSTIRLMKHILRQNCFDISAVSLTTILTLDLHFDQLIVIGDIFPCFQVEISAVPD